MPVPIDQIITPIADDPAGVERIAHRKVKPSLDIVEYNPEWPQRYEEVKARLEKALGDFIAEITHAGSTSVPGLPAKDMVDVDLTLKDITDEASYVKPLEDAGFRFLLREPCWYQHRFFVEDWPNAYHVNLHVWGLDSPEAARHRIFRDWLRKTPADVELYAKAKREAAVHTTTAGGSMMDYTAHKESVIREIMNRAYRDLGYID